MNPDIKKSIIDVIKSNLVRTPNSITFESIEWAEQPKTQVATAEEPKARSIKSAMRKILGKKESETQAMPSEAKPEYTYTTYITIRKQSTSQGAEYTLSYGNTIFEQRSVYSSQKTLTPAQQDIVDIYETFKEQYHNQARNGYGPKLSGREMAIKKYLSELQK